MNREELVEYVKSMNYGETIDITVEDSNFNYILGALISKIKWFDSPVVIIGGYDDDLIISKNLIENDEFEAIEDVIEDCIGVSNVNIQIIKNGTVNIQFK